MELPKIERATAATILALGLGLVGIDIKIRQLREELADLRMHSDRLALDAGRWVLIPEDDERCGALSAVGQCALLSSHDGFHVYVTMTSGIGDGAVAIPEGERCEDFSANGFGQCVKREAHDGAHVFGLMSTGD